MLIRNRLQVVALLPALLLLQLRLTQPQASNVTAPDNTTYDDRIVNGWPTTWNRWPSFITLRQNGYFMCGGTLICPNVVLTAAHCVHRMQPGTFIVEGGTSYLARRGVRRQVARLIVHPRYNPRTTENDIAFMVLRRPMPRCIRPAKLLTRQPKVGERCIALGHGLRAENGRVSNVLRMVGVRIVAPQKCRSQYEGIGPITQRNVCARSTRRDSCSGDSGGPLHCNGGLMAVVSWGVGCARRDYPGVYAKVPAFTKMIRRVKRRYCKRSRRRCRFRS